MIWPVTKLPPGPASQRTASAMSSGTPARLTSVAATRWAWPSSVIRPAKNSLSVT
jgi:hypothetical protein